MKPQKYRKDEKTNMRKITVINMKGGVAKTTTVHTFSYGLARRGYRVLMVDLDPQCNLTENSQVKMEQDNIDLFELFQNYQDGEPYDSHDAVYPVAQMNEQIDGKLDLMYASLYMSTADTKFTEVGRESALADILSQLEDEYDFCFIDTPPTIGLLTANAIVASDECLIPATPSYFALNGMNVMIKQISQIKKKMKLKIKVNGILLTRTTHTLVSDAMTDEIAEAAKILETSVYSTTIRNSTKVEVAQYASEDVLAEDSNVARDYNEAIDEFLRREGL